MKTKTETDFKKKWNYFFGCDVHPIVQRIVDYAQKVEETESLDYVAWEITDDGIAFSMLIEMLENNSDPNASDWGSPLYLWRVKLPTLVTVSDQHPDTIVTCFVDDADTTLMASELYGDVLPTISSTLLGCFMRVMVGPNGVYVDYRFLEEKEKINADR